MLSSVELSWLEMVAEALRSALNALAQAAPDWLVGVAEPDWFRHYATRAEDSRFPKARAKRDEVGLRVGRDGMLLLEAVFAADAPPGLGTLTEVETLRQMWVQHFHLVEGEVRRRDPKDRPPGTLRLATPYDTEARGSVKRDTVWDGYKVHLTETCEPETPNLITNVATTLATVHDSVAVPEIHGALAERDCLPGEHWVDAGYPTAGQVVAAGREHGVVLHGRELGLEPVGLGSALMVRRRSWASAVVRLRCHAVRHSPTQRSIADRCVVSACAYGLKRAVGFRGFQL